MRLLLLLGALAGISIFLEAVSVIDVVHIYHGDLVWHDLAVITAWSQLAIATCNCVLCFIIFCGMRREIDRQDALGIYSSDEVPL